MNLKTYNIYHKNKKNQKYYTKIANFSTFFLIIKPHTKIVTKNKCETTPLKELNKPDKFVRMIL